MKIAIVHDFMVQMGGAEKVVEVLHEMFPSAPIYTSIYDAPRMPSCYRSWDIRPSFMQSFARRQKLHRLFLMLYPLAFESLDLNGYDLVISSSSAFAKGVVTQPSTIHISYTHTPMRFAWMPHTYLENESMRKMSRMLLTPGLHYLRNWDALASSRVDHYIANSTIVAQRIQKFYRRSAEIIPPPVNTRRFQIADSIGDYYIIVSRSVPYKRLDLAIAAFTRLKLPLKVVGDGRHLGALQAQAGPNIQFCGRVSDAELVQLLSRAKAFIMPGEEDFGIAPVEANACGRPVIAYAAGGALDSQVDGLTGVLFPRQSVDGLCEAVERFNTLRFDPRNIKAHAGQFDTSHFCRRLMDFIERSCGFTGLNGSSPAIQPEPCIPWMRNGSHERVHDESPY